VSVPTMTSPGAPAEPMTRRSFLSLGLRLTALMGLGSGAVPAMAEALERIARGQATALWLQGQCCSGCSISLLNTEPLGPDQLLTRYISLAFHQTLSGATGHQAVETVNRVIEQGGHVLIVEGAVPAGMPKACFFGEEAFPDQLKRAARGARAVIAVGTCATAGGIPGAPQNQTGAISVPRFLAAQGIAVPCISIPGCPAHPDWLVGTVAHVLQFGLPALDELNRPKAFFARTVHEQCPRFTDYERENFAATFGGEGCLFKLGCCGPLTKGDCTLRHWNGGTNTCIKAGAPCVGCAWEGFAARTEFPLYTKNGQART
jgi:hydrogenase small subunit